MDDDSGVPKAPSWFAEQQIGVIIHECLGAVLTFTAGRDDNMDEPVASGHAQAAPNGMQKKNNHVASICETGQHQLYQGSMG